MSARINAINKLKLMCSNRISSLGGGTGHAKPRSLRKTAQRSGSSAEVANCSSNKPTRYLRALLKTGHVIFADSFRDRRDSSAVLWPINMYFTFNSA